MLTLAENLFSSSSNIISLDELSVDAAKDRFCKYQTAGVIKDNCNFDSDIWYTTDEYAIVGLYFDFNIFTYQKYSGIFGLSFSQFVNAVKAYCLSLFGKNVLNSMENTLLDIKHLLSIMPEDIIQNIADLRLYSVNRLSDFLYYLINDDNDDTMNSLIAALDVYADIKYGAQTGFNQRELADFESYFEFEDILNEYWQSDLPSQERLFYYPLYLWWKLTCVIPLRPREFLLTQRDCLFIAADGRYNIKLRRNQLKGAHGELSYNIVDSYLIQPIPLPDYLGQVIEAYICETDKYESNTINTLFLTDPHYQKWGQHKHSNSRFLTYTNMVTILKSFFRDVIQDKYGYTVRYNVDEVNHDNKEICYIHLGDTRHLAFINLMQEGATPVTAMLLGGHTNIEMASHYYSNVTSLLECSTYRKYRKQLSGNVEYKLSLPAKTSLSGISKPLSDGGFCYSVEYLQGSISDCLNISGPNGEIGYCPECPFYRHNNLSYFSGDDIYKKRIETDSKELFLVVKSVMEGKGNFENIQEAILKLNSSQYSYKTYLEQKCMCEARES